jgi:hypothetical protein
MVSTLKNGGHLRCSKEWDQDGGGATLTAIRRENSEDRAGLFGFVGLLVGGILTYTAFHKLGGMDLPKWLRFSGVVVGAGVGAFILAKLADIIWGLIMTVVLLGIIYGIGTLVWHTV